MAVAGNKNDMYEYEEVPEAEAKNYAKEIDAIFQTTSAKVASGIDELFKMIGEKFLHPNNQEAIKNNKGSGQGGVDLNKNKGGTKKKCC